MEENIKEEIIKRYKYLYENKELILSLAINKAIEKKEINNSLKKLKKSKKDLQKHKKIENYEGLLNLLNISINECQKSLNEPKYYLFSKVKESLLIMFEEFLFSDYSIEQTELYNYIETIKNTPKFLSDVMTKINGVKERRSKNRFIRNTEAFTVWKILTYVRDNNLNNVCVLSALDKYYNIERYMLTNIDWNSGYIYLQIDEIMNEEYLNKPNDKIEPNTTYTAIISVYKGNEFEKEDDYFAYEWLEEKLVIESEPKTEFMKKLAESEMLDIESKQKLFSIINSIKVKKIVN